LVYNEEKWTIIFGLGGFGLGLINQYRITSETTHINHDGKEERKITIGKSHNNSIDGTSWVKPVLFGVLAWKLAIPTIALCGVSILLSYKK